MTMQTLKRLLIWFKSLFASKPVVKATASSQVAEEPIPKPEAGFFKKKVVLGAILRITPGKRHAWYESNVGIIRKPI